MDAACDVDSDIRSKSFNPFYNKLQKPQKDCAFYADKVLCHSMYLMTSAYSLIDKKRFQDILDNIILLGLPKKQKDSLFGKETDK